MQNIKLVTFDVFGTLIDWHSYVEAAFPGRYASFLQASVLRQLPQAAVLPYRKLLAEVGHELASRMGGLPPQRPTPEHVTQQQLMLEQSQFFADGFGCAPAFSDAGALQHLSLMCLIGCASNSDARHVLDVQKTLGIGFDLTVLAEDIGAYKPHTEAWDQIEHIVTTKMGYDKSSWLHVSAYVDFDLEPAKQRGINTCFIPRPGGGAASESDLTNTDFVVSDLWQLADLVASINGTPVRYEVKVTLSNSETTQAFAKWMRYEHGRDLLQVRGCQKFRVLQLAENVLMCDYVFTSHGALDAYLSGPAQEMRRRGRERFSEDEAKFERTSMDILSGYMQRSRYDFGSRRS